VDGRAAPWIAGWALRPPREKRSLSGGLQNYDEAASWGDEPYRWILDSLPPGAALADAQSALAEVIGAVLARHPDVEPLSAHREQLLYNLLQLAAAIHRPGRLWPPLLEMLNRRKLGGDFFGPTCWFRLRAALIGNQGDDQLKELWLRMGRKQEIFFRAPPFTGTTACSCFRRQTKSRHRWWQSR